MEKTTTNVFLGPEDGGNPISRHYDDRAEKYDTHTTFHAKLAREYVEFVEPKEGERVLDLACGTGMVGYELLSHAPISVIHGVDISPGMLSIARSKIPLVLASTAPKPLLHHPIPPISPPPQPEITFNQGDISNLSSLPFFSNKESIYNIVTICSAFILLPSPLLSLKSWIPYLEPGSGRLVLDIPHPKSMLGLAIFSRISKEFGIPVIGTSREWIKGTESLETMMQEAGLEKLKVFETRIFEDIPAATPLAGCGKMVGEDGGDLKGAREWDVEMGEKVYEEMLKGKGMDKWRSDEAGVKRKRWLEEWEKLSTNGKVREEGRLIIGVGYRGD
ncbi:hypothetical protein ACMFMF_008056 [Clarireedia jacksonii]